MADLKETILARVDIVEFIGNYVSLSPAGHEFKACCPFHEEKTASFHVNPAKGVYHCFGCKAGGSVIDFAMAMENLEFREALEWLANRYNIEIPRTGPSLKSANRKTRLIKLNAAAQKYFRQALKSPAGDACREYLEQRGIGPEQIADFDLGYAPREWFALGNLLIEHGARSQELEELGLIKRRQKPAPGGGGSDHYDTFRNRLVFPIRSVTGDVIAFAGRALAADDKPKYLNVTNTPLYDKSRVLYNLDRAKGLLRDEGAVLVEGYMDVIGLAAAGVGNTVASCGTALTEDHARLLARYTDRFYLAFDADEAGARATWGAGVKFLQQGLDVRVIRLPEGEDPDDFVNARGHGAWQAQVDAAESLVQFWLGEQLHRTPKPDATQKMNWVQQLRGLYGLLANELLRQDFVRDVAGVLRLGAAQVAQMLSSSPARTEGIRRPRRTYRSPGRVDYRTMNVPVLYPREGEMVAELLSQEQQHKSQHQRAAHNIALTNMLSVEREVVRRLLTDEEMLSIYLALAEDPAEDVPGWFADRRLSDIFDRLVDGATPEELTHGNDHGTLAAELITQQPFLDTNECLLDRHRNQYIERRIASVTAEVNRAIAAGNTQQESELFAELNRLKREIRPINRKIVEEQ